MAASLLTAASSKHLALFLRPELSGSHAPTLAAQFQLSSARNPTFSYDVAWDKSVIIKPRVERQFLSKPPFSDRPRGLASHLEIVPITECQFLARQL